jgi:SAM-dependent methyltransferase
MSELHRSWPGAERRRPSLSDVTWAVREPLARWLERQAAAAARELGRRYRVLDVGCGAKPYYPFFAPHVDAYVGVDLDNPGADLQGAVEALPVDDGSFDVVLCTQVLEHAEDPARAVRELRRVTASGGRVLASTHGVQVYHPAPLDLWRWTHEGLERLFRANGDWASVDVSPGAGSAACVTMLAVTYLDLAAKRAHATPLGRALVAGLNRAAAALDARVADLREPRPGSIFANLHVEARVAP